MNIDILIPDTMRALCYYTAIGGPFEMDFFSVCGAGWLMGMFIVNDNVSTGLSLQLSPSIMFLLLRTTDSIAC